MQTNLIGTVEAGRRLGKSASTIVRWARSGRLEIALELPGYRGDLLFTAEEIDAAKERDHAAA